MQRIVTTLFVVTLATLLGAGSAWAGPETGSLTPILPRTDKPTTLFGYAGQRPLDSNTPSGIAHPTPAPRVETAAFGAATRCLPVKPKLVTPTAAPDCFGSSSDDVRIVVRECSDGSCSPCDTLRISISTRRAWCAPSASPAPSSIASAFSMTTR